MMTPTLSAATDVTISMNLTADTCASLYQDYATQGKLTSCQDVVMGSRKPIKIMQKIFGRWTNKWIQIKFWHFYANIFILSGPDFSLWNLCLFKYCTSIIFIYFCCVRYCIKQVFCVTFMHNIMQGRRLHQWSKKHSNKSNYRNLNLASVVQKCPR